jgi:hypothetical protein
MGTVRRSLRSVHTRGVDPVRAFTFSVEGIGLEGWWPGTLMFDDEAQARRAWPQVRRDVWAQTRRFRVPGAAERFDSLTMQAVAFLHARWHQAGLFDLVGALAALAADRHHLSAFEATRAGRDIRQYLALVREDLTIIEALAHDLAATPDHGDRHHPGAVTNTAETYGACLERPEREGA